MNKKRLLVLITVFVMAMFMFACTNDVKQNNSSLELKKISNTTHPEEMGNKDCIECHKDVAPELVQQWEQSAHGFTGVKCQVCHGDEKNFNSIPSNNTCRGCHADQFENSTAADKSCSSCHTAHNFTIHKVRNYK